MVVFVDDVGGNLALNDPREEGGHTRRHVTA
jgi:hypothetical protein